jgi:hypothetical protein
VPFYIRRFIAAIEIAGGFLGMALASTSATSPGLNLFHRVWTGLLGIPFALCAYAGRALWLDQSRGYLLSALVQAAQLVAWSSPNLLYVFYCGGQLGAWLGGENLLPQWGLGSRLTLNVVAGPGGDALVGVNLVAVWALAYLALAWRAKTRAPVSRWLRSPVQDETIIPGSP